MITALPDPQAPCMEFFLKSHALHKQEHERVA